MERAVEPLTLPVTLWMVWGCPGFLDAIVTMHKQRMLVEDYYSSFPCMLGTLQPFVPVCFEDSEVDLCKCYSYSKIMELI